MSDGFSAYPAVPPTTTPTPNPIKAPNGPAIAPMAAPLTPVTPAPPSERSGCTVPQALTPTAIKAAAVAILNFVIVFPKWLDGPSPGTLAPRDLVEYAILRTAWNVGSEYEYVQHRNLAKGCNYPQSKIDAIPVWPNSTVYNEKERALLMALGLPYDSKEGRAWAAAITSLMTGHSYATSARTASRMGPFAGFAENEKYMLNVLRMHRDRKSTRLNSSHVALSRMPSSA